MSCTCCSPAPRSRRAPPFPSRGRVGTTPIRRDAWVSLGGSRLPHPACPGPRALPVGSLLRDEKRTARTVGTLFPAIRFSRERTGAVRSERIRGPQSLPTAGPPPPGLSGVEPRACEERAARQLPVPRPESPRPRVLQSASMASEELARKLERRLRREEAEEGSRLTASLGAPAPEPPARPPTACADAELSAQLSRRLDINEGAARPRRCRVFNPYTEFPEFSRRLIKDLESMFKL
ncbi:hypothetical protein P7K49_013448 [Saguinus oedipus]|uniref:Uncharacterized protein n=1 Tax=Saguinus oedipus TaxID=9490 RepID=A0ABQ9VG21_SAGOE|nr:hypothetical protein P7K49_013448 [Saguinus oedipus]